MARTQLDPARAVDRPRTTTATDPTYRRLKRDIRAKGVSAIERRAIQTVMANKGVGRAEARSRIRARTASNKATGGLRAHRVTDPSGHTLRKVGLREWRRLHPGAAAAPAHGGGGGGTAHAGEKPGRHVTTYPEAVGRDRAKARRASARAAAGRHRTALTSDQERERRQNRPTPATPQNRRGAHGGAFLHGHVNTTRPTPGTERETGTGLQGGNRSTGTWKAPRERPGPGVAKLRAKRKQAKALAAMRVKVQEAKYAAQRLLRQ